jgi:hypothetical protein
MARSRGTSGAFTCLGQGLAPYSHGGEVGVMFSKGVDDAGHSTDLPDLGPNDPSFVLARFVPARSVVWETAPFASTPGAIDVRVLRVLANTAIGSATALGLDVTP